MSPLILTPRSEAAQGSHRDAAPASSIILESGRPVISMGGWSGSDDAMTFAKLKSQVKSGKLHYIVVSSNGGQSTNSEISTCVKKHGTAVTACSGLYRLNASDVS